MEDNDFQLNAICKIWDKLNLPYDIAKNGLAAYNLFWNNYKQGIIYPFIWMDLIMPFLNGY